MKSIIWTFATEGQNAEGQRKQEEAERVEGARITRGQNEGVGDGRMDV